MGALERAATDHADALNIGHDRMVADFGSLWMLVRSRLELTRLPAADEALTVRTWLRSPTPVMSVRDYDFCADGEVIGLGRALLGARECRGAAHDRPAGRSPLCGSCPCMHRSGKRACAA